MLFEAKECNMIFATLQARLAVSVQCNLHDKLSLT